MQKAATAVMGNTLLDGLLFNGPFVVQVRIFGRLNFSDGLYVEPTVSAARGLGYLKTKDVVAVRFIIFIKNQTTNSNCVTCRCEMYRWFYGLLENIILNDVIWICLEIFKWISIKQITADAVYWIDKYIWCWRRLAVMLGYENADNQL